MDVTIAIPTYFANNMLTNCVQSILANVEQPKILIYKNDIGWLQACNKVMMETTGDIILLNDDTYVLSDIVAEMSTLAYSNKDIGIVGGKSLSSNQDTILNYGIYIGTDGNTAHRHFGQSRDSVKVEAQRAVEGSCIYIKRQVIDDIGYFDDEYGFGYREEVDYCFRAREIGYKVVSCPTAEYVHFTSQTHGKLGIENDKFEYFMTKWGTKLALGRI